MAKMGVKVGKDVRELLPQSLRLCHRGALGVLWVRGLLIEISCIKFV